MLLVYRPPSQDVLKFGKHVVETGEGESWLSVANPRSGRTRSGHPLLRPNAFCERLTPTTRTSTTPGSYAPGSTKHTKQHDDMGMDVNGLHYNWSG